MKKIVSKYKLIFLSILLAVAILVPMQNLLVSAREVIEPLSISTSGDDVDIDDIDGDGTGESGSSASGDETAPFEGYQISSTAMSTQLYSALLDVYKAEKGVSYSTIYTDMFADFTQIDISNKGIDSLTGMEKLELTELVTFKADLNPLSSFDEDCLSQTDYKKFANLSLAGCENISDVKLTKLVGLKDINLSGNKLSSIDLSAMTYESQSDITLNLAGNNISSMSSIVLPSRRVGHVSLNIINNRITEIPSEYFTDKYTIFAGIQGFSTLDDKYVTDTKSNVTIYRMGNSDLKLEIYKIDGDSDELKYSIVDSDIADEEYSKKLSLPVGEYEYRYKILVDGEYEDAYKIGVKDVNRKYLTSGKFNIIPQKPTYIFVYKDKEYKTLNKVTGAVTVKVSAEENATLMYQVNNGEWQTGDTIECSNGGTYSIKVKSVVGGVESEVSTILVRTSLNLYIPDGVMLVFVLLIALVLFLVVIPIISKKYFKKD